MPSNSETASWLDINEIESKANDLRSRFNMESAPINSFEIASRLDYAVRLAIFEDPNLAGQISNRSGYFIIDVAGYDPYVRQRFTVAHEIGHALLHLERAKGVFVDNRETTLTRYTTVLGVPNSRADRREWQANAFAASLLMPKDLVNEALADKRTVETLAKYFDVSQVAMQRRLAELNVVL
jgi:hypothetical protein